MQFANPWGLLALLGIPAVLIIHSLRRSPKSYLTNTLFLIEAKLRDPGGGRRLRRLRRSAQLWLRLLLVALFAWVVARPVAVREDSTQRIVLVLDVSASMSAAMDHLAPALEAALTPMGRQTAHTEWIVLSSLPDAPPLHRGWDDLDGLITELAEQDPRSGSHDPSRAIDLAQTLAGGNGRVLFISDHLPDPAPAGIGVLSIGTAIANVGWCGVDVSPDGSWRAILRNYTDLAQERTLTGGDGSQTRITLAPGEWRSLEGRIPDGSDQASVTLTADEFVLDDQLHLVRHREKLLRWTALAAAPALGRLFGACGMVPAEDAAAADLELRTNDLAPPVSGHARLLIATRPVEDAPYVDVPATAAAHPLTEGLIFDGLLWRKCAPLDPPRPGDSVLLWSGADPLAILRGTDLELGFHPELSNFTRVPSALVLIQRWIDTLRAAKVAPEARQLATADRFEIAADPAGAPVRVRNHSVDQVHPAAQRIRLLAPGTPGLMTVAQGETILMEAAVNFVDPVESDLRHADAGFIPPAEPTSTLREATRPDRFRDLWLLLILASLLLSWAFPESAPKPLAA